MLARTAPSGIDPQAYLVSEKLDGVRALWDGHVLRFRSGRVVAAPAWFLAQLPRQPLDGELWMGRRRFDELSAAVRRTEPVDAEWRQVRYHVFELPGAGGRFAERAEQMQSLANPVIVPVAVKPEAPSRSFATPKSVKKTSPRLSSMAFDGFMSRWMTPF